MPHSKPTFSSRRKCSLPAAHHHPRVQAQIELHFLRCAAAPKTDRAMVATHHAQHRAWGTVLRLRKKPFLLNAREDCRAEQTWFRRLARWSLRRCFSEPCLSCCWTLSQAASTARSSRDIMLGRAWSLCALWHSAHTSGKQAAQPRGLLYYTKSFSNKSGHHTKSFTNNQDIIQSPKDFV
jgi:hypothetical protein